MTDSKSDITMNDSRGRPSRRAAAVASQKLIDLSSDTDSGSESEKEAEPTPQKRRKTINLNKKVIKLVGEHHECGSLNMTCETVLVEPLDWECEEEPLSDVQKRAFEAQERAYKYYLRTKAEFERQGAVFKHMSNAAQSVDLNPSSLVRPFLNSTGKTTQTVMFKPPPGTTSASPLVLPAGSFIIQLPVGSGGATQYIQIPPMHVKRTTP